jgi:hypothetical protein
MLGRRFQLVVAPWIDTQILSDPIPSTQPFDVARYRSSSSKWEGLLAEIYKLVPVQLHVHMRESTQFATLVRKPDFYIHLQTDLDFSVS